MKLLLALFISVPVYALFISVPVYAQSLEIPLYTDAPKMGLQLKSNDVLGLPPLQVGMAMEPTGGYTLWLNLNSTVARDGGGSFMEFMTPLKSGKMVSGATINAGLINATPGQEGGDFEIMMPCKGVYNRGGYNCGVAMDGTTQAFYPTFGGDTALGQPNLPWGDAWITRLATPVTTCPGGGECIRVLAGGVPGYVKIER